MTSPVDLHPSPCRASGLSRAAFWVLIALAFGLAGRASAQEVAVKADPAITAAARGLAIDGLALAKAGQCAEAVDKLERAEALRHSIIVETQLAECYVHQGRLVEAGELFRDVLREPAPARASVATVDARRRAQAGLLTTKQHTAELTVNIEGVRPSDVQLSLDGTPLPAPLVGAPMPIDPGDHFVEARAPHRQTVREHVTLGSAERRAIVLTLAPPAREPLSRASRAAERHREPTRVALPSKQDVGERPSPEPMPAAERALSTSDATKATASPAAPSALADREMPQPPRARALPNELATLTE